METYQLSSKIVLLADDDTDHGQLFKQALKNVAPEKSLVIVNDGQELLKVLRFMRPGIIFLDLKMPGMDGFECLKEIKSNEKLKNMKVVVYSNSSNMGDIQKSYLYEADLYMVKPFASEHLYNAFHSIFSMQWDK